MFAPRNKGPMMRKREQLIEWAILAKVIRNL